MERRRGLWLALGIWGSVAGCQHTTTSLPSAAGQPPGAVPLTPGSATDVADPKSARAPRKNLRPETYVRFGDFRANEAAAPDAAPAVRDQLRDDARRSYQYALSLDSNCLPAHRGLARLYGAMQDYPRAVAAYNKALQIAPRDAQLWFELGMCHNRARDLDRTGEALSRAVELEPENRTYVNALAVALARAGRFDESLRCFARANNEAMAHYYLGCTLRRLDQPQLAYRHLQIAVGMNPQLEAARVALAEMAGAPAAGAAVQPAGYAAPPGRP
jgi:tetratricopeptide (TPR) repeat protein